LPNAGKQFAFSAHGRRHVVGEESMKDAGRVDADEILPEYDFSHARPNQYASRYAAGSVVVVIEPDVAAVFPSAGEANEALRALAGLIQKHRPRRTASRRSANSVLR
jgi:hypothetical protein